MTAVRTEIRFLLNDREERLSAVRSSDTLLDHLRLDPAPDRHQGGLRRGRLRRLHRARRPPRRRRPRLRAGQRLHPPARLGRPLPRRHRRARRPRRRLHPIQTAMVDLHGSQCGFCTPGFVMSLYALWMRKPRRRARPRSRRRCRATSAAAPATSRSSPPPRRAGDASPADDPLLAERARVRAAPRRPRRRRPRRHPHRRRPRRGARRPSTTSPRSSSRLPKPTIVAGMTDVGLWITKFMRNISPAVFVAHLADLQAHRGRPRWRHHRRRRQLRRLPGDPRRRVPAPLRLLAPDRRLAGPRDGHRRRQHRQRLADRRHAPGADRARRHRDAAQGRRRAAPCRSRTSSSPTASRTGKPGEFVESITIPRPAAGTLNATYKVTKRRDEDISAVACGFHVALKDGAVDDRPPRLRRHGRDPEARRRGRGRARRPALDARDRRRAPRQASPRTSPR